MVPVRTKAVVAASSARKRVSSPSEASPTAGQKRTSKRVKALRRVIRRFRMKKAPALMVWLRILDKHILQVRLGDPEFLDAHPPRLEQAEEARKAGSRLVHGAGELPVPHGPLEQARETRQVGQGAGGPETDGVAQAQASLELRGGAFGQDRSPLQERPPVAQLLRLPHVVG